MEPTIESLTAHNKKLLQTSLTLEQQGIEKGRAESAVQIADLNTQIDKLNSDHNAALIAAKKDQDEKHVANVATLTTKHEEAIAALQGKLDLANSSHKTELEELTASHDKSLETLREEIATSKTKHEESLTALSETHSAKVEELNDQLSSLQSTITDLETKITELENDAAEKAAEKAKSDETLAYHQAKTDEGMKAAGPLIIKAISEEGITDPNEKAMLGYIFQQFSEFGTEREKVLAQKSKIKAEEDLEAAKIEAAKILEEAEAKLIEAETKLEQFSPKVVEEPVVEELTVKKNKKK